jgi:hypothetical protein
VEQELATFTGNISSFLFLVELVLLNIKLPVLWCVNHCTVSVLQVMASHVYCRGIREHKYSRGKVRIQ